MSTNRLVSIHGGHSGEFCNHAEDTLEEVIKSYIEKGFAWVGITEHIPPSEDRFLYDDEREAGHTAQSLQERFSLYIENCRAMQKKYINQIHVLVGFEAEAYSGYATHVKALLKQYRPDYFIGSVHHVRDQCIDANKEQYEKITEEVGGIIPLYCEYFDEQYEVIEELKPPVIGHFDLVRIFDEDYSNHLQHPEVKCRIERNLRLIQSHKLIMDFNVCPLWRGKIEPYISGWILKRSFKLGITLIPGDDSHGKNTVGLAIEDGIKILAEAGFATDFPVPNFHAADL